MTATHGHWPLDRRVRDDATVAIEDARTGFYMVRTAALHGARASLSGAHLADALGATVALARICHRQGYDGDEQRAEVTLDQLVAEHLRVSRERVVRILDQLQRAGVIERHSARFDGARRRPTEIRFTGAAVPFARVDAAAYEAIASAAGRGLLRHLALYVTLVDLAGDQRDEHGGKRRVAVTSYSGLELRSGASLRSVKDIIAALVAWGVLERHARHDANGMTEANRYRLIDLRPASDRGGATAELWSGDRRTVRVPQANDGGASPEQWDGETRTMAVRHPDDGGVGRPAHARATDIQNYQKQQNQTPLGGVEVGEGFPGSSGIDALCQRFLSSLDATLGPRRSARLVAGQHDKWRATASRLLEDFELSRLLAGSLDAHAPCPSSLPVPTRPCCAARPPDSASGPRPQATARTGCPGRPPGRTCAAPFRRSAATERAVPASRWPPRIPSSHISWTTSAGVPSARPTPITPPT